MLITKFPNHVTIRLIYQATNEFKKPLLLNKFVTQQTQLISNRFEPTVGIRLTEKGFYNEEVYMEFVLNDITVDQVKNALQDLFPVMSCSMGK